MTGHNYTQISGGQLLLLLITLVGATAVLYGPSMAIRTAGRDAWLSILVPATGYGLLVVWVTTKLALRFPRLSFREYTEVLAGRWGARVINFLYCLYVVTLLVVIVREFGNVLNTVFMPETPMVAFNLSLMALSIYAVWGGLEVICRVNQFHLPLLFGTIVFLFIFLARDVKLERLLPFLEGGMGPVLQGAIVPCAFRGEVFVLMWLASHLRKPWDSPRVGAGAVVLLGLFLTLDAFSILTILGKELASRETLATLSVVRYINIGDFLTRTEGLALAIWICTVVTKTSALLYIAVETAKATLGLEGNNGYLVGGLGFLILVAALYTFQNDLQVVWFLQYLFPPLSLLFQLILPGLLLGLAWVKKKGAPSRG